MHQSASIRSIIDEITLQIAQADLTATAIQDAITNQAVAHITKLIDDGALRYEVDIDRVTQAIVRGVLSRLQQIAESGGQIGSA
jgi:hypothetical protein